MKEGDDDEEDESMQDCLRCMEFIFVAIRMRLERKEKKEKNYTNKLSMKRDPRKKERKRERERDESLKNKHVSWVTIKKLLVRYESSHEFV